MTQRETLDSDFNAAIADLLDGNYQVLADPVIQDIQAILNQRSVDDALNRLEAELQRLSDAGKRLEADNKVLLATVAIIEQAIQQLIVPVENVSGDLVSTAKGAATLIQPLWVTTYDETDYPFDDPDYDESVDPAFLDGIKELGPMVAAILLQQVAYSRSRGLSTAATMQRLRRIARQLPLASIQRHMRTLYLSSYREAVVEWSKSNKQYIAYRIRVAQLDNRTCIPCIDLHGTKLGPDEGVYDHWFGRCDSIPVMKGTDVFIEPGESWLKRQPIEAQQEIMGKANYAAWADGAVSLSDFTDHYESELYGRMPVQASLVSILGDLAQQYYTRR